MIHRKHKTANNDLQGYKMSCINRLILWLSLVSHALAQVAGWGQCGGMNIS